MSEMVERVKLALREELKRIGYGVGTINAAQLADALARAAIAAMRQPTEDMVCAGDEQIIAALHDVTGFLRNPTPAEAAWQAMIDEALK
jgi:hypothetical protein